jgi:hypothetical protein
MISLEEIPPDMQLNLSDVSMQVLTVTSILACISLENAGRCRCR